MDCIFEQNELDCFRKKPGNRNKYIHTHPAEKGDNHDFESMERQMWGAVGSDDGADTATLRNGGVTTEIVVTQKTESKATVSDATVSDVAETNEDEVYDLASDSDSETLINDLILEEEVPFSLTALSVQSASSESYMAGALKMSVEVELIDSVACTPIDSWQEGVLPERDLYLVLGDGSGVTYTVDESLIMAEEDLDELYIDDIYYGHLSDDGAIMYLFDEEDFTLYKDAYESGATYEFMQGLELSEDEIYAILVSYSGHYAGKGQDSWASGYYIVLFQVSDSDDADDDKDLEDDVNPDDGKESGDNTGEEDNGQSDTPGTDEGGTDDSGTGSDTTDDGTENGGGETSGSSDSEETGTGDEESQKTESDSGNTSGSSSSGSGTSSSGNTSGTFESSDSDRSDSSSSSGGSSSSSGSSSSANSGTWVYEKVKDGWWYSYANGGYPKDEWKQLTWNNILNWYCFDKDGWMIVGWLDWNGSRYYLYPVSDGSLGHMVTGWMEIDGRWYYFGEDGALLINGTTPDGYQTDANGVRIG